MSAARSAGLSLVLLGVVKPPGDGVEEADQAGLADATAEQGVGRQSAEGVVADLGVGGRRAAMDEREVFIGGHYGRIK